MFEIVFCVGGIVLISLYVSTYVWVCRAGVYRILRDGPHLMQTVINSWLTPKKCTLDFFHDRIIRRMEQVQFEHTRNSCVHIGLGLCSVVVTALANILAGKPRWMTPEQDLILLLGILLCMAMANITNRLRLLRIRIVHFFYAAFLVMCSTWVIVANRSPETLLMSCISGWLFRFVLSMSYLDIWKSTFWNILCCISVSVKYSQATPNCNEYSSPRSLVYFDVCVTAVLLIVAAGYEKVYYAQVQQHVEAQASKIEQSAVVMLLDNACDVVLSLDSSFQLIDHSAKLAALLMLDSTRTLQGVELKHFMPLEEDKLRFEDKLRSLNGLTKPAANVLDVNMRDGSGSNFKVELLSVPYEALDSSIQYMVGIREFADTQLPPLSSSRKHRQLHGLEHSQQAGALREPTHHGTPPASYTNLLSTTTDAGKPDAPDDGFETVDRRSSLAPAAVVEPSPTISDMDDGQSSVVSSMSSTSLRSGRKQLAAPNLNETTQTAMLQSLLRMLMTWNIRIPKMSCCPFHGSQAEIKRQLKALAKLPCVPHFYEDCIWQCEACGILDPDWESSDSVPTCASCSYSQSTPLFLAPEEFSATPMAHPAPHMGEKGTGNTQQLWVL